MPLLAKNEIFPDISRRLALARVHYQAKPVQIMEVSDNRETNAVYLPLKRGRSASAASRVGVTAILRIDRPPPDPLQGEESERRLDHQRNRTRTRARRPNDRKVRPF